MDLRYEKKFCLDRELYQEVKLFLFRNSLCFRKVFKPRKINSIYFENNDLENFYDSIEGSSKRNKFRLRWYGNYQKVDCNFEIKQKFGSVGRKFIRKIKNIDFNKTLNQINLMDRLKEIGTFEFDYYNISSLHPIIYIAYDRCYFLSESKKVRITLDNNIEYSFLNKNNLVKSNKKIKDESMILEVKYSKDSESDFLISQNYFPFCSTRFSKYSNAINRLLK